MFNIQSDPLSLYDFNYSWFNEIFKLILKVLWNGLQVIDDLRIKSKLSLMG